MKKVNRSNITGIIGVALACCLFGSACSKDDYYMDGGLADPVFEGSVLAYLDSKPYEFDSVAQVIRLAGLEETFNNDEFTFFAPRDENIKALIGNIRIGNSVNNQLYYLGRDTIQTLADVDSLIWRKYLLRYMFRGKNKLMDYPQIDFEGLAAFPGQNYYAYNNTVSKIGVVYNDAGGVKYMGYRQLYIAYIPNLSEPDSYSTVPIASSDIQPYNGVVHVLDYTLTQFGYNQFEVRSDIVESKR